MTIARLSIVLSMTLAFAQNSQLLQVDTARPLKSALSEIEQKFHVPIYYEDPRFIWANDIVDVTNKVQNAEQKAANPKAEIFIPKGGKLSFQLPALSPPVDLNKTLPVVKELINVYETSGFPGRFSVRRVNNALIVEPRAIRNHHGKWVPASSILNDVKITLTSSNPAQVLDFVFAEVNKKSVVKIGLASGPILSLVNTSVNIDVIDQPAQSVILDLLHQMSIQGGTRSNTVFTYQIFHNPGKEAYLFHIVPIKFLS